MITEPQAEIDTTPFAAYVTAANSVEELREAKSSGRLAPGAAWALHVMEASFERVSKYTTPTQSEIDQLRSYFAEWDDEAGTSRANVLRMKSGGDLAQLPASVSPLGEQLAILCRDWYPVFLIHPEPNSSGVDPYELPAWDEIRGLGQHVHPATEQFKALFEALPAV